MKDHFYLNEAVIWSLGDSTIHPFYKQKFNYFGFFPYVTPPLWSPLYLGVQ